MVTTSTIAPQNPSLEQRENLARFLWTGFIVMFFAIQAIIWTIALLLTSNDPSHAVVMGFDERAATSQSHAEQQHSNRKLGWTIQCTWSSPNAGLSNAETIELTLKVHDREGRPVEATSINLAAFHCAQAAKIQAIEMKPIEPGVYRGRLSRHRSGQWQLAGRVYDRDRVFYISERFAW